jgi:geranylgeranyl pyrophosphate synthase
MILSEMKYQSNSHSLAEGNFSKTLKLIESRMLSLVTIDHHNISPAMGAARYHLDTGGQRIRAQLGAYSGHALGLTLADTIAISASVELLHNASLVHDDLQDKSETRRNSPSVWKKYGKHIAVCTGDLLIASAYAALATLSTKDHLPRLLKLFHKRIVCSINGQISDLSVKPANIKDLIIYERMAAAKSAPLFSLPTEIALIISGYDNILETSLTCHTQFAVAYQIFDDIQDLAEDRTNQCDSSSLNALIVLENTNTTDRAREIAIDRAQELLLNTTKQLKKLPKNCGALLTDYSETLFQQLLAQR